MPRTSIKASEDTHKMVIKTRGIFEQLFKRKLSLDDTIYLSTRLVSFIYETGLRLNALNKIQIIESENGSIKLKGLDNISEEVVRDLVKEFTEIDSKLAEKKKAVQVAMIEKSGET